mmetsp:Transcript_36158/g.62824  ORF Transcript_36158/g.62824 Transcript_36158/m.62824 type:complete len:233 (-) Transcript_36158:634-1332(-)
MAALLAASCLFTCLLCASSLLSSWVVTCRGALPATSPTPAACLNVLASTVSTFSLIPSRPVARSATCLLCVSSLDSTWAARCIAALLAASPAWMAPRKSPSPAACLKNLASMLSTLSFIPSRPVARSATCLLCDSNLASSWATRCVALPLAASTCLLCDSSLVSNWDVSCTALLLAASPAWMAPRKSPPSAACLSVLASTLSVFSRMLSRPAARSATCALSASSLVSSWPDS